MCISHPLYSEIYSSMQNYGNYGNLAIFPLLLARSWVAKGSSCEAHSRLTSSPLHSGNICANEAGVVGTDIARTEDEVARQPSSPDATNEGSEIA